eukprot:2867172-Prymnesium_polylepis.2
MLTHTAISLIDWQGSGHGPHPPSPRIGGMGHAHGTSERARDRWTLVSGQREQVPGDSRGGPAT